MKLAIFKKNFVIFGMAALLTNAPQIVTAETAMMMIPTSSVVAEMTKEQASNEVASFLKRSEVQQQLMERGLSANEVEQRLAALSQSELNSLALQMQEARAGGDILVTILVIVLIIFLIQRM